VSVTVGADYGARWYSEILILKGRRGVEMWIASMSSLNLMSAGQHASVFSSNLPWRGGWHTAP
jgi:hypothetical protein